MTTLLERKYDIIDNIVMYLDENEVRNKTTLFKNEYFTSIDLKKPNSSDEYDSIVYVFSKMKECPSNEEIAIAIVNRFLIEKKALGFKSELITKVRRSYHYDLLVEALNAYTLSQDIKLVERKNKFDIQNFIEIYEKNLDEEDLLKNEDVIKKICKIILLGSIDQNQKVNLPSLYAITEKFKIEKYKNILKKELLDSEYEFFENLI